LKINGFCVSFIGSMDKIHMGWYKNNLRNGNWMMIDGIDMSVIESGWYTDDVWKEDMKDDEELKNFDI